MRVMVLTDFSFAQREHQLLTRLEIGLADDGAAILHAIPLRCPADILNAFSSTVVRYDDSPSPMWRSVRARQVIANAKESLDTAELPVDVVHVFGRGAWQLGEAVAREANASLVLEVWRDDLVDEALGVARRLSGVNPGSLRVGLLTPAEQILERLRLGRGHTAGLGQAPWGVPGSDASRPVIDPTRGVALSILAEGRTASDVAEVKALLEGVERAARRIPNLLVFLDGSAADRSVIWRCARKLRVLDRLTAVAEMESRREPILQTDMLALPEPNGVCRTLPLAAAAEGVALLARPDPVHASWLSERTARMVGVGGLRPGAAARHLSRIASAEQWEQAIVGAVEDVAGTNARRGAARMLLREERTLSAYVQGVRRLYEEVRGGRMSPSTAALAAGA